MGKADTAGCRPREQRAQDAATLRHDGNFSGRQVADWTEPAATFQEADGSMVADLNLNTIDRFAKWRRIQVEAALRNYLF